MSRKDAMEVIAARRGRMYDPAIVDVFFERIVNANDAAAISAGETVESAPTVHAEPSPTPPPEIALMASLAREFAGLSIEGLAHRVRQHVLEVIPGSIALLYRYDTDTDELICDRLPDSFPEGQTLRVRPGTGITGWVAANRRPMANSDASLDLPELAQQHTPPLNVCISIPVVKAASLVGVVTVYSSQHVFSERDRIQVEELAAALVDPLMTAVAEMARTASNSTTTAAHVA
jgi:GAF domain-containing protein